jgi:hypothetical protein
MWYNPCHNIEFLTYFLLYGAETKNRSLYMVRDVHLTLTLWMIIQKNGAEAE